MSCQPTLKTDYIAPTPARSRRRNLELQRILHLKNVNFLFNQWIIYVDVFRGRTKKRQNRRCLLFARRLETCCFCEEPCCMFKIRCSLHCSNQIVNSKIQTQLTFLTSGVEQWSVKSRCGDWHLCEISVEFSLVLMFLNTAAWIILQN